MSQVGKLYKYYLGKIGQKNGVRIITFSLLIGVVGGFVFPGVGQKAIKGGIEGAEQLTNQQKTELVGSGSFQEFSEKAFGEGGHDSGRKDLRKSLVDYEQKLEEGDEKVKNFEGKQKFHVRFWQAIDEGDFSLFSIPYNSNNAFFFQKTDGYTEGKPFWKMLFEISWGNLMGVVVLYGFIFEVFDKIFFSPREDGEEATVLTMTPGIKRSDVLGGKVFAFLTFYFLINIVLFLIPFGIYYFWLSPEASLTGFALLALITVIVGPILFFGLIFAPYLFFGSCWGEGKGIFSTFITFFPLLWGGIKLISSAGGPYTVERIFFDPVGFSLISLVSGIFFLTLYYLRHQEEDIN